MILFLERNELDARLPMNKAQLSEIIPDAMISFFKTQWDFLPPVFKRDHHQHINDNLVLPFVKEQVLDELEGGFGSISQISISPSMQNMVSHQVGQLVAEIFLPYG